MTSGYDTGQCYNQTYDNNFKCIEGALKIPTLLFCPQPLQHKLLSQPLLWSCSQVVELGWNTACFLLAKMWPKMWLCLLGGRGSFKENPSKGAMRTSSSPVSVLGGLSAGRVRFPLCFYFPEFLVQVSIPGAWLRWGTLGVGCYSGMPPWGDEARFSLRMSVSGSILQP